MDTTRYGAALSELTRERFSGAPPRPYRTATKVVLLAADILPVSDFAAVLQAAADAVVQSTAPGRPLHWDFTDYFGHNIHKALGTGPSNAEVSRAVDESWHVLRTLHCLVDRADFADFIRCAQEALQADSALLSA